MGEASELACGFSRGEASLEAEEEVVFAAESVFIRGIRGLVFLNHGWTRMQRGNEGTRMFANDTRLAANQG